MAWKFETETTDAWSLLKKLEHLPATNRLCEDWLIQSYACQINMTCVYSTGQAAKRLNAPTRHGEVIVEWRSRDVRRSDAAGCSSRRTVRRGHCLTEDIQTTRRPSVSVGRHHWDRGQSGPCVAPCRLLSAAVSSASLHSRRLMSTLPTTTNCRPSVTRMFNTNTEFHDS